MSVSFEGFEFELDRFELRRDGALIAMEPQVFNVLAYLIEHRNRVVLKEELLDNIWGDRFVSESALTSRIKSLRHALGDDGVSQRFVRTSRGRGYRFVAEVESKTNFSNHTPRVLGATADGQNHPPQSGEDPLGSPTFFEAEGAVHHVHQSENRANPDRQPPVGDRQFHSPRTLEPVRHNLPIERTVLVGREAEITMVAELVRGHRLVTLLGIGGTGKTRLATAVAADQAPRFESGVWFVDLVPATTGDHVVEAIASAAGLQLNRSDLLVGLAELISDRQMLFVLDNCEHITDHVAEVVDFLLERTASPRWLTTSREPLTLSDERQVHVLPLASDSGKDAPAVQLFAAAAERVGVTITEHDVPMVADICAHLDGIPLSIELAASQLRHLQLTELATRLDQRFEILARGSGGRMRRQASLQAVLQDTWDMLGDQEEELLLQLAAFPSGFTLDDVESISTGVNVGVPALTLARLVDRSLVSHDVRGRHRLLETVKLFAQQRWSQGTDSERYIEHHTSWVLHRLSSFAPQDWFTSFAVLSWARAHYDDHRAVEDRLVDARRTGELVALLRTLTQTYCYETGTRASSVIERIERLLDYFELSPHERGLLNLVAASAGLPARRPDWIEKGSRDAVSLLRLESSSEELAAALVIESWMTVFGDFDRAIGMLNEAKQIADDADAPALANVAIAYAAGHHALVGRIDDAKQMLGQLQRRLEGRPFDYAGSLHGLFSLAVNFVSEPVIARAFGEVLATDFADIAGDAGIGWGLPTCNCVAVAACGDIEATRQSVAATEALTRLTSNDDGLPDLLLPAATLAWRLGYTEEARRWLTAIRHAAVPTQNFQLTIMYRQVRRQVGLLESSAISGAELRSHYREAVAWMAAL